MGKTRQDTVAFYTALLSHLQEEKDKELAESESTKIRELDDGYTADVFKWEQSLPARKKVSICNIFLLPLYPFCGFLQPC